MSDLVTDVERLHLEPGDVVVVRVDQRITVEQAARIKELVAPVVAPNRVLVTGSDVRLQVLSRDDPDVVLRDEDEP